MKRYFIAAIIFVLAIGLTLESTFIVTGNSQQKRMEAQLAGQISGLQEQISGLEAEKSNLQVELGKGTNENASLTERIRQLEDQIKNLEEANRTLADNEADLTKDIAAKNSSISTLSAETVALNNKFLCERSINDVNFKDNTSVSEALVKYVESTKTTLEPVTAHFWRLIWTGDKYSVHYVEVYSKKDRANYRWTFTAYFRGEAHGKHENGIFYNDDQCWLYLDK